MKIFVTTCDKFIRIMKGFAYMFNKHWSPDVEVTVLGYGVPPPGLPDNFKFVSLAKRQRDWTSDLIPFFKQLSDEYFGIILDDFYLRVDINKILLCEAEKHMVAGVDKVVFISLRYGNPFRRKGIGEEKDANFDIYRQDYKYRLALYPQFVRRDYFLKYLHPGKNIWQYETQFNATKNDGAQILAPKHDIAPYAAVVARGRISNPNEISKIKEEDLNALRQLGLSFRSGEAV